MEEKEIKKTILATDLLSTKERERIKVIVKKKTDEIIKKRTNMKSKRGRNISQLERLQKEILFLINRPDYVRVRDRKIDYKELMKEVENG